MRKLIYKFTVLAMMSCVFCAHAREVRTGRLPNGISYYVSHNARPAGHADFFLARAVGSVVEEENERGLTHFLEHMCFNGTENFPGNSLISYLESKGVKFGANLNAYTSTDETVYNISKVPVSENVIDSCLLIMRDWSCALTLTDDEIDAERGVIVNEWRQRRSAANRILEKVSPRIYPGSAYGSRLPIGLMSVVENFDPQTLRDFYKKWHRTDNEAVIVTGDIDVDAVVEKIKALFSPIPAAQGSVQPDFDVPSTPELIVAVESDPEQGVDMLQLHFKHKEAEAAALEEQVRGELRSELLTSMLAGRFDRIEADPECPYHHLGIGDSKFFLSRSVGSLMMRGITQPGREAETLGVWYGEVLRARRHGFMPGELALAKAEMISRLQKRLSHVTDNTALAKKYVRHFLDGGVHSDDSAEVALAESMLPGITAQEVQDYLCSIVNENGADAVVLLYKPEAGLDGGDIAALEDKLAESFRMTADSEIVPFEDFDLNGPLLDTDPAPGAISASDLLPEFDAEIYTLSNGVRVFARKSVAQPGQIFVRGVREGGQLAYYTHGNEASLKMFNDAVGVSRFGRYTSADLKKMLTGRDIAMSTDMDETKETVEISTSPADMRDAFRLLYLRLTDIRPDSDAFSIMRRNQVQTLGRRYTNATQAMGDSIHRNVFCHHPLAAKITSREAAEADYGEILAVYRRSFGDATGFSYYVTGDFDPDSLRACLETYVASLPASGVAHKIPDSGYRHTPGHIVRKFNMPMETPQAIVYNFFSGPAEYNVANSVAATALGQIVKSRLLTDLREDRGWTYGIQGHCSVIPSVNGCDSSSFLFPVYIKTSPEHADSVAESVSAVLAAVAATAPAESEVAKVREYLLKNNANGADDNAYWLSVLKVYDLDGANMVRDFVPAVEALTPDEVSRFAREVVLKGSHSLLMMLPEKQ